MDRKEFLKTCGIVCFGGSLLSPLLTGCGTAKIVRGAITGPDFIVPLSDFDDATEGNGHSLTYIVAHNNQLQYPIYIYRFDERSFSALWMRCSHQGTELQAFGDRLECPAHGSVFNNQGETEKGPAAMPLRRFPVTIENNQLKISLK